MSENNEDTLSRIILREGREKSLLRSHPWVFSGAIEEVKGSPALGDTVMVTDRRGKELAKGAFSPHSQIRVRCWTFDPSVTVNKQLFSDKIDEVRRFRKPWFDKDNNAGRLIFGESDGLPGVIADVYADVVVCQFLSAGAEKWKDEIAEILYQKLEAKTVYERSDAEIRHKEGLKPVKGTLKGEDPPETVEIMQDGLRFLVDVKKGHKTGFYLDQKLNRRMIGSYCGGLDVLNVFSYTGSFTAEAIRSGAKKVVGIDSSFAAHELAKRNLELNGLNNDRAEFISGDAFSVMRELVEKEMKFDLVVTDPPKFAETKSQMAKASRAYKDINFQAARLLRPGGYLAAFSCSGVMERSLFQKIVGDALRDAGLHGRILHEMDQSPDHPVSLNFPESRYLKGLFCRIDS